MPPPPHPPVPPRDSAPGQGCPVTHVRVREEGRGAYNLNAHAKRRRPDWRAQCRGRAQQGRTATGHARSGQWAGCQPQVAGRPGLRLARKSTAGVRMGCRSGVQVWARGAGELRPETEAAPETSSPGTSSLRCNQRPLSSRTIQKRNSPAFRPSDNTLRATSPRSLRRSTGQHDNADFYYYH